MYQTKQIGGRKTIIKETTEEQLSYSTKEKTTHAKLQATKHSRDAHTEEFALEVCPQIIF